jgi:NAD(P)-dependent dehydrogenase (short-subunit alcohol dehydrogenase family)
MKKINEMFDLSGKVVILTGAAGFLGSEFADVLSEAGANVVLADIREHECKDLAKNLSKKYSTAPLGIFVDVTDKTSVEEMVNRIVSKYSKIDSLINNAIYEPRTRDLHAPLEDFSLENWNKVIAVNLTGVFLCAQAVGKQMVRQGYGSIINISSIYGIVGADQRIYGKSGINSSVAYAASKGGVVNLTRFLATYWEGKNIRVNALTLGGVFNRQDNEFVKNYCYRTPLGRMANKWDYRGAILFLVSDASLYMTGANLIVDGGWTAW